MDNKYKEIFSPYVARRLLRMGNSIVDIKPDKKEGREGRTIFIFEVTEKFNSDIASASKH